ncbi:MAG: sugar ABC transporter substrate-binding protein [Chloroflexi bacterium]|nr:sugar ABC transporter substrate-binding protein [Chloroflexota bacterium]MCC6892902.1 sugar ABC transporter substrate-binding protein [Anaerolineae bacterium]
MRKSSVSLLIVLLFVLSGALIPAMAQEPVTITISTWAGVDEAAQLQAIIDGINEGNTAYQIVHQPLPADYYTQIQTQLAGGTAADLLWMDQNHMSLAADGSFLPLNECVAGAEPGSAGDVADYYPGVIQTAYQGDTLYGLPWIAQPVVVYFNKDMFDAAGVEQPTADWTWDDFLEKAAALTQDTDGDGNIDQWGTIANGWPPPQMFIWQAGGDVISEDQATSPIDSPEAVAGIDFYRSWIYNPEMAPSPDIIAEQGFDALYSSGKIGMFFGGASDDKDYNVQGFTPGVVPVPKNPTTGSNVTFSWTASTVINAATAHPEEACAALIAITDGITNWKVVSPRMSQATVEHLIASVPEKEANAQAFLDAAQNMSAFRIIPKFAEWEGLLWSDYLNPLLNNETDLTTAELAAQVRATLEEVLPGAAG